MRWNRWLRRTLPRPWPWPRGARSPKSGSTSPAAPLRNSAAWAVLAALLLIPGVEEGTGRYLVVVRDDVPVDAMASECPGRVLFVYRHALRGFAVDDLPEAAARALARDPRVRWVERDRPVALSQSQTAPPWGLDRIDERDSPPDGFYRYDATGTGVTAYVLDTGIRITHVDFQGRARYGYDFIDDDAVASDGHGHGTHVAGTIGGATYGVAKQVSLVAVRVLDNLGQGTITKVIAGVDWVTANAARPAVANMSLTGTASPTLDAAVQNSIASGIPYCVAAGNGKVIGVIGIPIIGTPEDACLSSPARVPEAITVGATEELNDAEASFSNFGACVDLLAPGVNILSAGHTSDTATAVMSGTSMATPHVTGAAALLLQGSPSGSPAQVDAALKQMATRDKITGMSSPLTPNLLLYTRDIRSTGSLPGTGSGGGGGGSCGLLGWEGLLLLAFRLRGRAGRVSRRRRGS